MIQTSLGCVDKPDCGCSNDQRTGLQGLGDFPYPDSYYNPATYVTPFVSVDSPTASQVIAGTTQFYGWALENTAGIGKYAIAKIDIYVDGVFVAKASYGTNRFDVCNLYPARLGCPNVGWQYWFNTATVSNGSHTVKVVATDTAGNAGSTSVSFMVLNPVTSVIVPVIQKDNPPPVSVPVQQIPVVPVSANPPNPTVQTGVTEVVSQITNALPSGIFSSPLVLGGLGLGALYLLFGRGE